MVALEGESGRCGRASFGWGVARICDVRSYREGPYASKPAEKFPEIFGGVFRGGSRPLWILAGSVASDEIPRKVPIAQERAGATGFEWHPRVKTAQRGCDA